MTIQGERVVQLEQYIHCCLRALGPLEDSLSPAHASVVVKLSCFHQVLLHAIPGRVAGPGLPEQRGGNHLPGVACMVQQGLLRPSRQLCERRAGSRHGKVIEVRVGQASPGEELIQELALPCSTGREGQACNPQRAHHPSVQVSTHPRNSMHVQGFIAALGIGSQATSCHPSFPACIALCAASARVCHWSYGEVDVHVFKKSLKIG
mmetsp:Transcript_33821/g.78226  ORF Transcript_33821/g.78226 Transcript_33821/m.78226 type:complete len:206 (-) Transcript_33821:478-1095(-)